MKDNELTVMINKPVEEVFNFTINPANTPRWIDFLVEEQTNEWPVRLGTIYKNKNKSGEWAEYKVTKYEPNKLFIFSKVNDPYNVKYTFSSRGPNKTELIYYEWVEDGVLDDLFSQKEMEKLKEVLESQ